ncbi:ATP-binding protein [Oscillatoria sp. FACHB-1406]|uniref:ATP-binding protein n=1 Tax=Oscillatoria sp. FACHB-1406 TaxID=2692846 RepID=UPI001688FC0B|nr:ATP-binding protein [Oscillatoria sp. FACHB-1406]MBD2577903.1 ATP-binding protein [Oscillatoria sp. FACHB-1406]
MQDFNIPQQLQLQLKTELGALNEILQRFEQMVTPLISEEQYWQCQIALAEGFTNAVRHAHKDLPLTTTIEVEVKVVPEYLEIRIWDWGQPFDLHAKLRELNCSLEDPLGQGEGGRGLFFMSKLTDELSYTRGSDARNCLVMRKYLRSKG